MNSEWLTYTEAERLKESGEWISASNVSELVRKELIRLWPDIVNCLLIDVRQHEDTVVSLISSYLVNTVDQRAVLLPVSESPDHSLLLGHDTIIRIGPTIKDGSWEALTILASAVAILSSHTDIITRAVLLKKSADSLKSLMYTLSTSCERLDEREKFVVIAIAKAKSRVEIINYDAAIRNDHLHSIGEVDPTFDNIVEAIVRSKLDANFPAGWDGPVTEWQSELRAMLEDLKKRKALKEKNDRWILQQVFLPSLNIRKP
jgi:hypothetical protein